MKVMTNDLPLEPRLLVRNSQTFMAAAANSLVSQEKTYRRQARQIWWEGIKQTLGLSPKSKKKVRR